MVTPMNDSDPPGETDVPEATDADALALLKDAAEFQAAYLDKALQDGLAEAQNPAAMIYALLDSAMQLSKHHFPGNPESLYASATQMVFEAHFGSNN